MGLLIKVIALLAIGAATSKKGRTFIRTVLEICWPTAFPPKENAEEVSDDGAEENRNGKRSKKKADNKEFAEEHS